MRSDAVVIVSIAFQNPAQMRLAQDNDVVHTLTPDRSDQPFGKAILPGRGWCDRCVSAWNKDPLFGVIGIQSGPRDKGPQWLPSSHGSRGWDAGGGNDCEDPS